MTFADLKEDNSHYAPAFPIRVFHNRPTGSNVLRPHWHEQFEIIYMVSGSAVFDIGGFSYEAGAGDVLFVNSGELHSGYSIQNSRVDYYAVVYDPALLSALSIDASYVQFIAPFLASRKRFPHHVARKDDSHHSGLQTFVRKLIEEYEEKPLAFEMNMKSYLFLIITYILRHYGQTDSEANRMRSAAIDRFKPLLQELEARYAETISVETAAKWAGLSPNHLCTQFKKATGRTFVQYVHLLRINEAEKLLLETDLPITRIAEKVGFCSINHLDKVFKKVRLYPPSHVRK